MSDAKLKTYAKNHLFEPMLQKQCSAEHAKNKLIKACVREKKIHMSHLNYLNPLPDASPGGPKLPKLSTPSPWV